MSLLATPAGAGQGGVRIGPPTGNLGVNTPADVGLIDAWNDTQTPVTGVSYFADCWGYAYRPSQNYDLDRVEFYAGDLAGTVSVAILADDGSGFPTGPVLSAVTYQETPPRRWQGASTVPSVTLMAGTLYYIRYQVVVGALSSMARLGTGIPIYDAVSYGCVDWVRSGSYPWMARFYGSVVTPTKRGTWGLIKTLYR